LTNSKWLWAFTTYKPYKYLPDATASIPDGDDFLINDLTGNKQSLAWAWNKMIGEGLKDYQTVIVCNDDIKVLRPDTGRAMDFMLHGPSKTRDGVMINAYDSNIYGDKGYLFTSGFLFYMPDHNKENKIYPTPGFFCFAVGQDLIDKVGWFDEKFKPCFYEDIDMVRRIALAKKVLYVGPPIAHIGSGSWDSNPARVKVREKARLKSQKHYIAKWGGDMGQEKFTTEFNK
jgi:hypothetical protein